MFKKFFNSLRVWWYNRGKTYEPPQEESIQETTEEPVAEPVKIPVVGANLAWCPFAVKGTGMKVQGKYECGHPRGAVVHFTAGQCDTEQHAKDSLSWGIGEGYAFFVIGPTGVIYQSFPLTHWGHHAGSSSYEGLGSGLSKHLVGIEIACAGMVDNAGKAWFGKRFSADRLRHSEKKANIQAGTYVMYTQEQEASLMKLLVWLYQNNPSVFEIKYIVGHDEIAPTRKNDPGASLSMTMPELRAKVMELCKS